MTIADRWLLPEGVNEVLPEEAVRIEALRRKLLDLYASWGYELVFPPIIEFCESLLIGLGNDIDLQSFKVVDQLSGRTLAIRADITPQVARIDAHSLPRDEPSRFCYVGTVLHTRPKSLLASRIPIEVGAELYGETGSCGDSEVISLMLETLQYAGIENLYLDLGHVGIYRSLVNEAQLSKEGETQLFEALQRKASVEINEHVEQYISDPNLAEMFLALAQLHGGSDVLVRARQVFAKAPASVLAAIDMLEVVASRVAQRMPQVEIYFDLGQLRGYHYHTGLVFGAFAPGLGEAIANGGRYDGVGEVFGRGRPATGFSADLQSMLQLQGQQSATVSGIFAPLQHESDSYWTKVAELRASGERVVCGFNGQKHDSSCDRRLQESAGQWQVVSL